MNLKELLKDEQKRKIVLLCLYLFMMFVIVLMVRINPGNNIVQNDITKTDDIEIIDNVSAIEKLKYTNYQYEYNVTRNEENYIITGTRYNDEEIFNCNNKNYFLKQNELYEIDGYRIIMTNENTSFFNQIRSEKIYDLISNLEPILELDVNDEVSKEYNVSTFEMDSINIKTYEKNKYINKIELNYVSSGLNVVINYSNVNKVSKLNTNFVEE